MGNLREPKDYKVSVRLLNGGVNTDMDVEFIGALEEKFFCIDQRNYRPSSDSGGGGALNSIEGEVLLYDFSYLSTDPYTCQISCRIGNAIVCMWTPVEPGGEVYITYNDQVVLGTDALPYTASSLIDYDTSDECGLGLLFITDDENDPLFFDIKDMVDSIGTQKYFDDFNIKEYIPSFDTSIERPLFDGLANVGSGGGLRTGQYSYRTRYISSADDATGWSAPTPLIYVPVETSNDNYSVWRFWKTRGSDASSVKTKFGIAIRIRVDNRNNYDHIEISRHSYNDSAGINFTPTGYIIDKIPLTAGQVGIINYTDTTDDEALIPLSDVEDIGTMSVIIGARSVRYFRGRVNLFNVKYASRDILNEVSFVAGDRIFPTKKRLTKAGYKNVHNHVNYRGYMNGEAYGFAVVFYDGRMERSLAVPIDDSFVFPNLRDKMADYPNSAAHSDTPVIAATVDATVEATFEVFDPRTAVSKGTTHNDEYINIMNAGSKGGVSAGDIGYKPSLPASVADARQNYMKRFNTHKYTNVGVKTPNYPEGYAQEYLATGAGFLGVETWPSWAKSFSITRTKRAGRVVAQGLGMYSLVSGKLSVPPLGTFASRHQKSLNALWCHFPDIDNGLVGSDVIQNLISNPSNYKLQLVSPLGFFSEVFTFLSGDLGNAYDSKIDMIAHAKAMGEFNDKRIHDDGATTDYGIPDGVGSGFTAYGKWRNSSAFPGFVFENNDDGNKLFDIIQVEEEFEEEGASRFKIQVSPNVYLNISNGGDVHFVETGVKNFQEPWYIINIVQTGAEPRSDDSTPFIHTGQYQKLESIIGFGDGTPNQLFEPFDERLDDYHVAEGADNSINKFVYVNVNGVHQRYINTSNKNGAQIVVIDADITNGTTVHAGVVLHGRYTTIGVTLGTIHFNSPYHPPVGSEIIVKYDNTAPIKFFGGDTFIGEAFHPFVHRSVPSGVSWLNFPDQFIFGAGFPYYHYDMAENVFIVNRESGVNRIQDLNILRVQVVRQLVANFICQTYSHLALNYNDGFPMVNYVPRPHSWSNTQKNNFTPDGNIFNQYETDYGSDEFNRWELGGLRILNYPINPDYSNELNHDVSYKRPKVGYTEVTRFCTRIASSLSKLVNNPNNRRLRSFPLDLTYDIPDNYGQITKGWSGSSTDKAGRSRGDNLFALTERGIAMLLTDKRALTAISGEELALIGAEGNSFILDFEFTSKGIGLPENFLRTFSEFNDMCYFANKYSVYIMLNGDPQDILRSNYRKKVYKEGVALITNSYLDSIASVIDTRYNEYWLSIGTIDYDALELLVSLYNTSATVINIGLNTVNLAKPFMFITDHDDLLTVNLESGFGLADASICIENKYVVGGIDVNLGVAGVFRLELGETVRVYYDGFNLIVDNTIKCAHTEVPYNTELYVFSADELVKNWIGRFDYKFSRFVSFDSRSFGMRDLRISELHTGLIINGEPITSDVIVPFAPDRIFTKEFVRFSVSGKNNGNKPDVYILNEDGAVVRTVAPADISDFGAVDLLQSKHEQYTGRKDTNNARIQGTHTIVKVQYAAPSKVRTVAIQYKILK